MVHHQSYSNGRRRQWQPATDAVGTQQNNLCYRVTIKPYGVRPYRPHRLLISIHFILHCTLLRSSTFNRNIRAVETEELGRQLTHIQKIGIHNIYTTRLID